MFGRSIADYDERQRKHKIESLLMINDGWWLARLVEKAGIGALEYGPDCDCQTKIAQAQLLSCSL